MLNRKRVVRKRWVAAIGVCVLAAPATNRPGVHDELRHRVLDDRGRQPPGHAAGGSAVLPPYWNPVGINVGHVDYEYRLSRTEITVGQHLSSCGRTRVLGWPSRRGALVGSWIFYQGNGTYAAYPAQRISRRTCRGTTPRGLQLAPQRQIGRAVGVRERRTTRPRSSPGRAGSSRRRGIPSARFWIRRWMSGPRACTMTLTDTGRARRGTGPTPTRATRCLSAATHRKAGQTSAGIPFTGNPAGWVPVGSYPDVQSPWGCWMGRG